MSNTIDWSIAKNSLHTLKQTEGGYSGAKRGIITLPNGKKMFIKIALNDSNNKHINREIEVYRWLQPKNLSFMPKLHSYTDGGLLIDDLSDYDFSDTWTDQKLVDVMAFIDTLADTKIDDSDDFLKSLDYDNGWQVLVDDTNLRDTVIKKLKEQGVKLSLTTIKEFAQISNDYHKKGTDIVHMDVRADNVAYNHQTRQTIVIDWNWCSLGNKNLDKTALLISVKRQNFDISKYEHSIDKVAALWLAGLWFSCFSKPIFEGGNPNLRDVQLKSGLIAYRLSF